MEEEIIFKIELNRPEAEADLKAIVTAVTSLKDENKLLTESVKNLQKAEGDNTKQIVEATAQLELNKNKIKELNGQQNQLIKTLDAEKGSINQLKAANIALLKERDNISKSTAEGKARIEALNKQYDENSKKINENISDTERQKQGYNTLIDILDKINPGTKELVTNVGTISKGFTQSIGAINQYGFSLKALGSIPILQILTAVTAAVGFLTSIYEKSIPTVEDFRKENEKLTKEYGRQKDILDLLESSTERQIKILEAIGGKEAEINKLRKETAEERLGIESKRAQQLSAELLNLQMRYEALKPQKDKGFAKELETLKEAISQTSKEYKDQVDVVNSTYNEIEVLTIQQTNFIDKTADDRSKKAKERQEKELEELEKLEQRRRNILLKGIDRIGSEDETGKAILDAYTTLIDSQNEKDLERQDILDGLNQRFIKSQDERNENSKKISNAELKRKKESVDQEIKIERFKNQALIGFVEATTRAKSLARVALNSVFKKDAILEAFTSTKAGAIAAYKALAGIPIVGPALGALAAGAVTAYGLTQVAAITGVNFPGFATSGRTISGTKINSTHGTPITRSNGDNLLATVKTGEVILNERHQAMLGGNRTFARIGVPGFADSGRVNLTNEIARQSESSAFQASLFNSISQIQTVLVLQDFEAKSKQVNSVKQRSVVLK